MKADEIMMALRRCSTGCCGDDCAYEAAAAAIRENGGFVRCTDLLASDTVELIGRMKRTGHPLNEQKILDGLEAFRTEIEKSGTFTISPRGKARHMDVLQKAIALIKTQARQLEADDQPHGTFECFHCGARAVVWGSDFEFDEYGIDGDGIVQECECTNCGARITYYIPMDQGDDDQSGP